MNTTELPPPNLEQKIEMLLELVNDFRVSLLERMDKLEEDSRTRYVDLRQRIDTQGERLSRMEERQMRMEERQVQMEERQVRMEQDLTELRQESTFLVTHFYQIDRKVDVFVNEFNLLKERIREVEPTRRFLS